jgi:GMP synthase-like glutamine amidotransferase
LRAAGCELVTVELDHGEPIPPLESYDLLLVMGGPMDVWQEDAHPWLSEEKAAIREWVTERQRPFLGVCLGHQLLADALGGEVGSMAVAEVGVCQVNMTADAVTDSLFAGLPRQLDAVQWHSAEVRQTPPGSTLLATNAASGIQAFRVFDHAWGIQFHVEASPDTVAKWARVASYRAALEASYPDGVERFLAAIADRRQHLERISAALTEQLLSLTS